MSFLLVKWNLNEQFHSFLTPAQVLGNQNLTILDTSVTFFHDSEF